MLPKAYGHPLQEDVSLLTDGVIMYHEIARFAWFLRATLSDDLGVVRPRAATSSKCEPLLGHDSLSTDTDCSVESETA